MIFPILCRLFHILSLTKGLEIVFYRGSEVNGRSRLQVIVLMGPNRPVKKITTKNTGNTFVYENYHYKFPKKRLITMIVIVKMITISKETRPKSQLGTPSVIFLTVTYNQKEFGGKNTIF